MCEKPNDGLLGEAPYYYSFFFVGDPTKNRNVKHRPSNDELIERE